MPELLRYEHLVHHQIAAQGYWPPIQRQVPYLSPVLESQVFLGSLAPRAFPCSLAYIAGERIFPTRKFYKFQENTHRVDHSVCNIVPAIVQAKSLPPNRAPHATVMCRKRGVVTRLFA